MKLSNQFLSSLDQVALARLASNFIEKKDYENLELVARANTSSLGIYTALNLFDREAVSTILSNTEVGEQYLNSTIDNWIQNVTNTDRMEIIEATTINLDNQDFIKIKGQILKDLTSFKIKNINELNKQNNQDHKIDKVTLGILAQFLSEEDFNKYLADKAIDFTALELSTSDTSFFPSLLFKNAKPLIPSIPNNASAIQRVQLLNNVLNYAKVRF